MNEKRVHIYVNLLTALVIFIFSFLLLYFRINDIYVRGVFLLCLLIVYKWRTPKIMLYEILGKKFRKRKIDSLKKIFNEQTNEFKHDDFSVIGVKNEKYILGIHSLKMPCSVFEYLVIVDVGHYWFQPSQFPQKYNENSPNLVRHCDGNIEFVSDDIFRIVHNGNCWYYIMNEEDIEKVLERINLNVI